MATTTHKTAAPQAAILRRTSAPSAAPAPTPANTPALRSEHAVALSAGLLAELGDTAKEAAAKERPALGRISLKSGQMSYQGNPVSGNNMDVIIVGSTHRNVYYSGAYDPDNIVNPSCFALSEDGEGMQAHENVPDENVPGDSEKTAREGDRDCTGCAMGEWGSAMRNGRPSKGKACKQTRRLMLLPADCLDDGAEGVLKAEMAILDVPVTSVKNYSGLVSSLAATMNLPVFCVVTNIEVTPDARNQFNVNFNPIQPAGEEEIIRALMKRRDEALRIGLQPYDGVGGEADPAAETSKPAAPVKNKFAPKKR